jgi:acyl carrier protein
VGDANKIKMIEIFRTVFFDLEGQDDAIVTKYSKHASSTWDSAAHLLLLTCIEEGFGIKIPDEEALVIDSFASAVAFVI